MKKKYKGYFKKPTYVADKAVREYIKIKRTYSNYDKFRLGLWVKLYLREIK